ncbi:MAG: GLPGLI family protein [Mucilaginibacter sp.]|uniref:GLPGLI family protein n=1 Tax=Mucilaginibacter sp. TaxID=1882438 RepID=UPI003267F26F
MNNMKTLYWLGIAVILLNYNTALSQSLRLNSPFIIEYDRTVNTYAVIKKLLGKDPMALDAEKFEAYKKTQPQFKVLKSTLSYKNGKSLFVPAAADISIRPLFNVPFAEQQNTVYTDLSNKRIVSEKDLSGDFLLLTDSTRNIRWKITDETREVMGYQCRRANALVLDSVYVVAFYTDDIHVSGGPELFSGLPGMILELALPHDNVIWRASKITLTEPVINIAPPKKGRIVNYKQLEELFKTRAKNKVSAEAGLFIKDWLL